MWYDTDWLYRQKITVDHTELSGDVTDFAVYLDLSDMSTGFFSHVLSDGGDIRITTDDGVTEAPVEVVNIDTGGSTGEVHFKGDLSASTDTDFYVYYGNSGASLPSASSTYGSQNVWTAYPIWHGQNVATDSSSVGANGTLIGGATYSTGQIGDGFALATTGDSVRINAVNLTITNAFTLKIWAKTSATSGTHQFISEDGTTRIFQFRYNGGNQIQLIRFDTSGSLIQTVSSSTISIGDNAWHRVIVTFDTTNGTVIYLDGVKVGNNSNTTPNHNIVTGERVLIGARVNSSPTNAWSGSLDEPQILGTSMTVDEVKADFNNQNDPSTFYAIGAEEDVPTSITSNFFYFF